MKMRKFWGDSLMVLAAIGIVYLLPIMPQKYSSSNQAGNYMALFGFFVGLLCFYFGYKLSGRRWKFLSIPKGRKWPFGTLSDLDRGKIHLAEDYYLTPKWRSFAKWLWVIITLILLYIFFHSIINYWLAPERVAVLPLM